MTGPNDTPTGGLPPSPVPRGPEERRDGPHPYDLWPDREPTFDHSEVVGGPGYCLTCGGMKPDRFAWCEPCLSRGIWTSSSQPASPDMATLDPDADYARMTPEELEWSDWLRSPRFQPGWWVPWGITIGALLALSMLI